MDHSVIGYTIPSKRRVGGVMRRTKRWHKVIQIGGSVMVLCVVIFIVLHSTSLHPAPSPPPTTTTDHASNHPTDPIDSHLIDKGKYQGDSSNNNKHPHYPSSPHITDGSIKKKGGGGGVPVVGVSTALSPLAARLAGIHDLQLGDHEHLRTIEDVLIDMEPSMGDGKVDEGIANNKRKFGEKLEKLQVEHVSHDSPLSIYSRVVEPCDPASAPFDNSTAQAICTEFMGIVISAAMAGLDGGGGSGGGGGGLYNHRDRFVVTLKASLPYRWRFRGDITATGNDDLYDRTFVVHFRPLYPQFEQRTVKYSATISTLDVADWEAEREADGDDGGDEAISSKKKRKGGRPVVMGEGGEKLRGGQLGVIIKVPQSLFPREPFSEVMAYHLDRKLGINRVPPTSLVFLPVAFIVNISRHRQLVDVPMDDMLLRESGVKDYDSWIDNDYGNYIRRSGGGNNMNKRSVGNGTHNWASIQLRLLEVRPSLDTMLQLPYSKKNPGWHRWLSPDFKDIGLTEPAVLALSQLAMFDFITANDDRSPNKNSFVVGGCKACAGHLRRPSGLHPTFVHLDQGMSLFENVPLLSHNPIGKTPKKVKFCIFYKPLIRTIRDALLHHGDGGGKGGFAASPIEGGDLSSSSSTLAEWVETQVPKSALSNIGSGSIGKTLGKRMWALVKRLVHCVDEFAANGTSVILRP